MKKTRTIALMAVLMFFSTMASAQSVETGELIWQHNFSEGMPSEFQRNAGWLDTGTYGCEWSRSCDDGSQTDTGGAYEPASIQGNYLHLLGKKSSSTAIAFPTHLENQRDSINNWVFHYRVDPYPNTNDKHSQRPTAGFRTSPNWYDEHNRPGRSPGVNWRDEGSTIDINGEKNSVTENSNMDAVNNEYHVKVAAKPEETLVKYWQAGASEPDTWNHQADVSLDGVPAFLTYAAFHENRHNDYLFYDLRSISTNDGPLEPANPDPANDQTAVDTDTTLKVDVTDSDSDKMNVTFYNASDDTQIATHTNVASGSTASAQWQGLEPATTYRWYAVADDGQATNQSSKWNFTTQSEPEIDESSATPTTGEASANPELSVDLNHPDNKKMYATFFVNDTIKGEEQEIDGSGTASVTVEDLNASSTYDWHVVVEDEDGVAVNNEDNKWTFTTETGNPGIEIEYGDQVNFNPDSVVLDVKPNHSYADQIDNITLLDDSGTVVDQVSNADEGQTLSLLWEGLEQDRRYNWTAKIQHDGQTAQTAQASFTTLTLGINLEEDVPNAEVYNIYRREGLETESADFDYGSADYTYIGSDTSIELIDASESLSEGDYCYLATSENMRDESPPSNEFCIQDVSLR